MRSMLRSAALAALLTAPGARARGDGTEYRLELKEPPATHYGERAPSARDAEYVALVEALPGASYDAGLGQAARELARFEAREGRRAPGELVDFVLDAAAALPTGVVLLRVETQGHGASRLAAELDLELPRLLRELGRTAGDPIRVGIGAALAMDSRAARRLIVLAGPGGIELGSVARELEPGRELWVEARLAEGAPEDVRALVLTSDGVLCELDCVSPGPGIVRLALDPGSAPGEALVTLVVGPDAAPVVLAELRFELGRALARGYQGVEPGDPSALPGDAEASALGLALVQAERRRHGLEPFIPDARLAALALAHSREMRELGQVEHDSPTTGGPSERLRRAGLSVVASAENVGRDASPWHAQRALLRSLGHRRNLLSAELTHVGVGVAVGAEPGLLSYYVTQLFTRPAPQVGAAEARVALLRAIRGARARAELGSLREDPELDRLAAEQATLEREPLPEQVLEVARARGLMSRRAWASVMRLPELEALAIEAPLLDARFARLGLGVAQQPAAEPPNIQVVVILAE